MSDEEFSDLIRRIHQELDEIQHVLARITDGWERARRLNDDYYLDSNAELSAFIVFIEQS